MHSEATYHGKDEGGNFWYEMGDKLQWMTGNQKNKIDFDLSTVTGKALALDACHPLAMVADRCGRMMENGRYYVVDSKGNEKPRFGDIERLLSRPNALQNGKMFLKQVEIYLKVFGYCPVYTLRAIRSDIPDAMMVIPPWAFHIVASGKMFGEKSFDDIVRRVYIQWGNNTIDLGKEEYFVIHDSVVSIPENAGSEIVFRSPVDTLSHHARNYMAQLIARGNLIVNGGPKGILYGNDTTDTGNAALTPKESDELQKRFKDKYGIVNKLYEIFVTPKKLGWITLGSNTQQLMLHEEDKSCMQEIAGTFGINPNLVMPNTTYDNLSAAQKSAYQDVIIPDGENIAEALTDAICPGVATIQIDFSHVACLQQDMSKKASALSSASSAVSSLYDSGLITLDEARMELANFTDIDPDNPKGEYKTTKNNDGDGKQQIQE